MFITCNILISYASYVKGHCTVCSLRTTSAGICRRRGGPNVCSLQGKEGLFFLFYKNIFSSQTHTNTLSHTHTSLDLSPLCLHHHHQAPPSPPPPPPPPSPQTSPVATTHPRHTLLPRSLSLPSSPPSPPSPPFSDDDDDGLLLLPSLSLSL
ncbi:hypothetical protein HanRHA438_Chr16g0754111 [Helianthus annuus]|nr:hypothetical protein HanRHA438_Chr16g0754111 [Helianthus annuus]